jgi:putative FmdB family regulatory protein
MMPIYEYECEKCACRFDVKRGFSEDKGRPCCPKCRGNVRQIFSPTGILFKGSGFYITDSRKKIDRQLEENKPATAESGKKEEGKTGKVEGAQKAEGKVDKVDGPKKVEGKTDKVQSSNKSSRK